MTSAVAPRNQPLDAFLAWEREQPERWERVGSRVWMMTGGTIDHNRITRNVAARLSDRLEDACEVFTNGVRVVTPAEDVMYPDVVVACGDIDGRATRLDAPVVVVEVLSESTAARDHGPKRWAYQTIPSLQHFVLIDQSAPVVEVATRDADGSWRSVIHRDLEARLRLETPDVEMGLDEVFARVEFADRADPRPAGEA